MDASPSSRHTDIHRRDAMSNPLDSLPATIGLGFVLTLVLYFVVKALV
jgi:hypothetical protein